jgi:carboxyl-terminal processing protease
MKSMKKQLIWIYIILWILIWFFWYQEFFTKQTPKAQEIQSYKRFDEVLETLNFLYYEQEKINTWKMIESALKAYVDAIEDPYTSYLDAETNSWFQEDLKWEANFEWIGAVISKKDYYVLIEEVIKESPAFNSELLPLDRIVIIDETPTKDLSINEAVKLIRWPKWSTVSLWIERIHKDQTKEVLEKKVVRDSISIPSVSSKILESKEKIWYLEISLIGNETENLLKKELIKLQKEEIKKLIIDLRWNGWWFLPIAVDIASHFVPRNKLIVSSKYKQLGEESFYSKWYEWPKVPIVVLIDKLTASAWEIIALALQEQIGAKIIWTQSFGKWSIQTMQDFQDWASLKYTIGNRYSPSGKNVDKIWVLPDITIEFDPELYKDEKIDNQLEKAKEIILTM